MRICIDVCARVRVSAKKGKQEKSIPRVVFRFGKQDKQAKKFLETRKFILDSLKRLEKGLKSNIPNTALES